MNELNALLLTALSIGFFHTGVRFNDYNYPDNYCSRIILRPKENKY